MSAPGCTANASYAAIAASEFDGANADFSLVWRVDQPTPAQVFDFNMSDRIFTFIRGANMTYAHINAILSAHNVLGPGTCCIPTWLTDGYPFSLATRTNETYNWTQAQVRSFMQKRIEAVVPRWVNSGVPVRGIIPINEAIANQPFIGRAGWPYNWLMGPEENIMAWAFGNTSDWFGQAFRWVRAAADGAGASNLQLFYNDYGLETPGPKADAVLRWVSEQRAAGVPIDGVGFQAHLPCDCAGMPGCNVTDVVAANMQRFVKAGLHVWVTELDVKMQGSCTFDNQAAVYDAILGACLAISPHCDVSAIIPAHSLASPRLVLSERCCAQSFMVWGFTDHLWSPTQWLAGKAPSIFDGDYRPKPAYFALRKRLGQPLQQPPPYLSRPSLKTTDSTVLLTVVNVVVALAQLNPAVGGTYLHASKSIDGPYEPVIPPGCNDSTGIWQRNETIPFGAGIAGGYGGGPFLVDAETAAASGLQEGNIAVITTCVCFLVLCL